MKNEKKLRGYETVWTCDFCGKEFKTKKESDKHELVCKKNNNKDFFLKIKVPNKKTILITVFIFLGIYLFTYLITNSYAKSNGLSKKNINNPLKWFSSEAKKEKPSIPISIEELMLKLNSTPNITSSPNLIPKVVKPTTIPIDTDPIVNCNMNANCGGGIRKIKQSECNNGTCCQIGGSWIFYISRQKCIEDQKKHTSNYVYPTSKPYPTYSYVDPKVYLVPTVYIVPTMSQEQMQNEIDKHNQDVQNCRDNVSRYYDEIRVGCIHRFGGASGAGEACIKLNEDQRQSAYNNCGTIY